MSNPIISVKNLVKKYGDFTAVNGISFEVKEGEIFGLLGPNGAGKTTTLEIIETLRDKTSGEVIVDSINLDNAPQEIKKIIGVQLQAAGYYPNLNLKQIQCSFSLNKDARPLMGYEGLFQLNLFLLLLLQFNLFYFLIIITIEYLL